MSTHEGYRDELARQASVLTRADQIRRERQRREYYPEKYQLSSSAPEVIIPAEAPETVKRLGYLKKGLNTIRQARRGSHPEPEIMPSIG